VSGRTGRGGLGFGGTVGLGAATVLIITVIAIGRALARQLEGAASVVIVFATVTICVVLAAAAIAALGVLIYRGQLARLHVAERRAEVAERGRAASWRAEVLESAAEDSDAAALELPHVVTSRAVHPHCPDPSCHHNAPEALPAWRRSPGEAGRDG
jgi:hypothetical protein